MRKLCFVSLAALVCMPVAAGTPEVGAREALIAALQAYPTKNAPTVESYSITVKASNSEWIVYFRDVRELPTADGDMMMSVNKKTGKVTLKSNTYWNSGTVRVLTPSHTL